MGNCFPVIIAVIPCHTRDFCYGVRQTSVKLDPWETLCCLARDWKFTLIFTKVVKSACFALSNQCAICRLCLPEVWWWECKNELLKEWFISLVWFFFAAVSIRSSENIYFGISLRVFWHKCRRFSMDLSQDFRSMWDFKSRLEFCLKCMKACCKVNSDYGLTMSAINYLLTKSAKCVNYWFSHKCKFISLHTHAFCHGWNFSSSKSGLCFSSGYEPRLVIRNKKVGCQAILKTKQCTSLNFIDQLILVKVPHE